jgi:hypothetical protein
MPGYPRTAESGDNHPMTTAVGVYALEQNVAELIRLRGPDHPETLSKRADLARCRQKAGDLRGALRDYESLLPDLVRTLGRENAGTLDVGTALATDHEGAVDQRTAIVDYDRRVQHLLNRLGATYSRLL